jgi:hypothetical protein
MSKAKSGGGITMNKVVQTRNPKVEPKPHAISLGATSRLGNMVSTDTPHKSLIAGAGYSTPVGPTSNLDARPGGNGRMIMKSGSQGTHGPTVSGVARPGAGQRIFPGFK